MKLESVCIFPIGYQENGLCLATLDSISCSLWGFIALGIRGDLRGDTGNIRLADVRRGLAGSLLVEIQQRRLP